MLSRHRGGDVSYEIPVLDIQGYDLDTIFEKELYFLLPFYIFRYENEFDLIEKDLDRLAQLKNTYVDIEQRLEQLKVDKKITEYTKKTLMEMSMRVLKQIAQKHEVIKKEVLGVMGGKVLEYETKSIYRLGKSLGMGEECFQDENLWKIRCVAKTLVENVESLMETMSLSLENACEALKITNQKYNDSKIVLYGAEE